MIFVCCGSRGYQFDRLIKEVDRLCKMGVITDEVFAQIGSGYFLPTEFFYKRFITNAEFCDYQNRADIIISHAGTGALIGALKKGKQVISVPRLAKFGEHIDDHQTQISSILRDEGYLREVLDIEDLEGIIKKAIEEPIEKTYNKASTMISVIENQIDKWFEKV